MFALQIFVIVSSSVEEVKSRLAMPTAKVIQGAGEKKMLIAPTIGRQAGRILAKLLKTKPNDLQSKLLEENISYGDALDELEPILCHAADGISDTRKPALPDSWVAHRAKVLQEQLAARKSIDTREAIAIISRDERWPDDKKGERCIAIRAMKTVADIAPLKAIYSPGTRIAGSV